MSLLTLTPGEQSIQKIVTIVRQLIRLVNSILVSAGHIIGTATNDSAAAGEVGEYIESKILVANAVNLTTLVTANITSISLTPGDWDVTGEALYTGNAATTVNYIVTSLNTVSATISQLPGQFAENDKYGTTIYTQGFGIESQIVGPMRFSLGATTTIYMAALSGFAVSTATAYGLLRARRAR